MSRFPRFWKVWADRLVAALVVSGVLASGVLLSACARPAPGAAALTVTAAPVPHQLARIVYVLPDGSPSRLVKAKELAVAAIDVLEPGDEIIVVKSDFSLVTSQVVPGTRADPAEVAGCGQVAVGGASLHCQEVLLGQRQLDRWRDDLVRQIQGVQGKPDGPTLPDDCRLDSGWPSQKVLQLLLAFAEQVDTNALDVLILGGGDADARGDSPRLPASYLAQVHVVDAPYTMTCGNPTNLQDWFRDAASVRLFGAERPASEFPQFLFQTSPSAVAGKAR